MLSNDDNSNYVFQGCVANVRNVSSILKAIHFKDIATVALTENGLKVIVEDSKCIQGKAFIQTQVFQDYVLNTDPEPFVISLDVLLECLTIFGSSNIPSSVAATVKMVYAGYGSPLVLTLEEDGVITDCSIKTQEADELLDFEFCGANVTAKVIMRADGLRDAFNNLDNTSDALTIMITPDAPHFRMSTSGEMGLYHHDIPKDSDIMESFECEQTQVNHYRLNLLKPSVKAVNLATKVCIRVDHRGFFSLQCMIKNENDQTCFVEFYCCPNEPMNDDDVDNNDPYLFR